MKQFMITAIIFFSIDLFWLGFVANKLYRKYIGHLMGDQVVVLAAVAFYLIFIIGLLHFVIRPALVKESLKFAVLTGMFFGFVTYATYDLTNLATLKNWPVAITAVDLVWGTVLSGLVSGIAYMILKR